MKACLIACVLLLTIVRVEMGCELKAWRQHEVLCCQNGSAIRGRHGKLIWIQKKPLICGPYQIEHATKETSVASIVAVVFGTIACVACHLYDAIAYCVYRFVRDIR